MPIVPEEVDFRDESKRINLNFYTFFKNFND